jgi:dihydroorotate dehydrogenase electron transfer subunit
MALAEKLLSHRGSVIVLIGACKKEHLLCERDFKKTGAKVFTATEDGSYGKKGRVTDILEDMLRLPVFGARSPIYACGPSGMLAAVARIAGANRIPCQVSLEERMACGVGVCLGCPVKVRTKSRQVEYKMVCKDGPVFNAEDIAW